jgi:hypothetical protein
MMRVFIFFFLIVASTLASQTLIAQNTSTLKIHFLYGSKPKKNCQHFQPKWFGGLLGGHAGIEVGNEKILHFLPNGKFHYVAQKNSHSKYVYNSYRSFYEVLGGDIDSNKAAIVSIPISAAQKKTYDSLVSRYLANAPYDYAFVGYRCGSATYEALAQLHILKAMGFNATKFRVFYPRKLRKKILKKAKENGWLIERREGCASRIWEKDV